MIDDGEIVVRYKTVANVLKPVRVLYMAGQDPIVEESMIDSADELRFDGYNVDVELDDRY
jgi:hypothetical protein